MVVIVDVVEYPEMSIRDETQFREGSVLKTEADAVLWGEAQGGKQEAAQDRPVRHDQITPWWTVEQILYAAARP